MRRLPITGAQLLSPSLGVADLRDVLQRLRVSHAFNDQAVSRIHCKIAEINGLWMVNQESKESAPVAKALLDIAKSLDVACTALSGHENGFRTTREIYATSFIAQNLALDAAVGENAQELISNFRQGARRIADAARTAHKALSQKSDQNGREQLVWHDRFTALLLDIAKRANIDAKLGNDPINDVPCGWLFEAATELEAFLYPDMRTESGAGRASRLRRSVNRLG